MKSAWVLVTSVAVHAAAAGPLAAQTPQVRQRSAIAAVGVMTTPRSSLVLDGSREVIGGTWIGGRGTVYLEPLVLEGTATYGTLGARENTLAFNRDGGELRGVGRIDMATFFGIEGGFTVRAFKSAAGYQRWLIPAVGGRIGFTLGQERLTAYLRGHYLPGVSVTGAAKPKLALLGEAGLRGYLNPLPFVLTADYRIERFDFPQAATSRIEHFQGLTIGLGLQLGRW